MVEYQKCLEAYILYVEYNKTLREVSRELKISPNTVKRYLDKLAFINDEMYQEYKRVSQKRRRNK